MLESFDKRHLVTPLLLHHDSERVRVRALLALEAARPELRERWAPAVERLLRDGSVEVRVAAVQALAAIHGERSAELMRAHIEDRDPRVATTAALTLAGSSREEDVVAAEVTLQRLAADTREGASEGRRQVAVALGRIRDRRFRPLLVPLMFDADLNVAREAVQSAGLPGEADELLLPPLVSLLRRRPLRATVRGVLAGRGESALEVLAYFLGEGTEDIEVRRQIPATLARIPSPRSVELLLASLADPDEVLRDQAIAALQSLRRSDESLVLARAPVEERALAEARRYFRCLSLRHNVLREDVPGSLLDRTLAERLERAVDRTWRLIGLVYPPRDVAVARRGIEGDARARARAAEYLDNLLGARCAASSSRCSRTSPRKRRCARATPCSRPASATSRTRSLSSSTTRTSCCPRRRSSGWRKRGSGRSPTTSSTCSRIATRATSTPSRRRRGRSPRGASRRRPAARAGGRRCRRPKWPTGCCKCPCCALPRWRPSSASRAWGAPSGPRAGTFSPRRVLRPRRCSSCSRATR